MCQSWETSVRSSNRWRKAWKALKKRRTNGKSGPRLVEQIEEWRAVNCLAYSQDDKTIKPQYAIERLYELTKKRDTFITTEVGQHQMWAAQFYKFEKPNRWMTSGGLGTMGYGSQPRSASKWLIRRSSSSTLPAKPRL